MRKRRTKGHIVADLGYNHAEKQVLLAGHVMTKVTSDYGYDGLVNTFDMNGEFEHRFFLVQVKSTGKTRFSVKNGGFELTLSKRDLLHWLNNPIVVAVVLYNLSTDRAYFLHVQRYFSEKKIELQNVRKFIQVFVPPENLFTAEVVNYFRTAKNP